jgi:transposase
MCLAHLLRDATYAIDEGDEGFALGFRFLLLRAVAIGRRRDALKDSTLAQYHGDLERRLDRLLAGAVPDKPAARRLFRAMRRDRDDLFRYITRRDVPFWRRTYCIPVRRHTNPLLAFSRIGSTA